MRRTIVPASVLQRVLGRIHQHFALSREIGVEGGIHAAEQGRGHRRTVELAILDGIDPSGHPAATNEGLVHFGLIVGGAFYRGVVQPDVRDVEPGEHATRCGLPSDTEQDVLATEGFFPLRATHLRR